MKVHPLRSINITLEITMPSKQYYLAVSDETVIELDSATGSTVTAKKNGQATVTLLDRSKVFSH